MIFIRLFTQSRTALHLTYLSPTSTTTAQLPILLRLFVSFVLFVFQANRPPSHQSHPLNYALRAFVSWCLCVFFPPAFTSESDLTLRTEDHRKILHRWNGASIPLRGLRSPLLHRCRGRVIQQGITTARLNRHLGHKSLRIDLQSQ